MMKFTLNQNQEIYQKPKIKANYVPSQLSMRFVMGYAAALQVQNSQSVGKIDILLN